MRINIEWKFHFTNITNARFLQQRHLQPCSRRGEQLRDPMHLITARAPQQLRPWPPSIHCLYWPWHLSLSLFKPKPPVWTAKTTTPLLLLEISRKGVEEGGEGAPWRRHPQDAWLSLWTSSTGFKTLNTVIAFCDRWQILIQYTKLCRWLRMSVCSAPVSG